MGQQELQTNRNFMDQNKPKYIPPVFYVIASREQEAQTRCSGGSIGLTCIGGYIGETSSSEIGILCVGANTHGVSCTSEETGAFCSEGKTPVSCEQGATEIQLLK